MKVLFGPDPKAVKCDGCGRYFSPTWEERARPDGGVLVFLRCDKCGAEYPSSVISAKGLILRQRYEYLDRQGKRKTAAGRRLLREFQAEVRRPEEAG